MSTYNINIENTGLETDEKVQHMAELMQDDGYDVAYTHNFGLVNTDAECPVSDYVWSAYLVCADAEA